MRAIDDITQAITITLGAAPTTAVQYTGMYCEGGTARGFAGVVGTTDDESIAHDFKRRKFAPGKVKELTISNPTGNSAATVTVSWRDDGPDPDEVQEIVLHRAVIPADGSAKYTEAQGWQLFTAGGLVRYSDDWYAAVTKGLIPGHSIVTKYGRNLSVGTGGEDIWAYTTMPWATAAFSAEFVSVSGNDTAAGSGCQELTVQGLDANWEYQSVATDSNGTSAVAIAGTWLRIWRAFVSRTGTYHDDNAGSMTVRVAGGGTIHNQIWVGEGQTTYGGYTVGAGKTAYLIYALITVDSGKTAQVIFNMCPNVNDVSTPFTGAKRRQLILDGIAGAVEYQPKAPRGPYAAYSDLWWYAKPSASAAISVDFQLLVVDDGY